MIAGVRRVVTRRARPREARTDGRVVVQARDASDDNGPRVEERLPPRDRGPGVGIRVVIRVCRFHPVVEQAERPRVERGTGWIAAERIVDAEEKWLPRQGQRAACGAVRVERASRVIPGLCGE